MMTILRNHLHINVVVLTLSVVIGAVVLKLTLTNGDLLPGLDGAYYWVQVRSLLNNGTLAYSDLPLVFWIQALIATLIGDIPLAVRLSDALFPVLATVPVWLFYRDGHKKTWYVLPLLLLVVLMHPIQLYFFTGDFIKNAAAVPLTVLLGWWLTHYNADTKWNTIFGISVTLTTIAITHFGVLLLGVRMIALWLFAHTLRDSPRSLLIRIGSMALVATLVMLLLAFLVPDRFERLIGVFRNTSLLFTNPIGLLMYFGIPRVTRPDIVFACVTGQLGAILLGGCAWRNRAKLSPNTRAVIFAFLSTTFIFSSPLISIELALRLTALSFVPLVLAAMVLWLHTTDTTTHVFVSVLISSTLLISAVIYPRGATSPVLRQSEWQDFQAMVNTVKLEQPSIVMARHGLDFLVAWYMRTHVADEEVTIIDTSNTYQAQYVLKDSKSAHTHTQGIIVYKNDTFTLSRIK